MQSRSVALAASLVAVSLSVGVTGCSSTSDKKTSASSAASKALTAEQRLAAGKKTFDTTSGMHLKLSSTDFPKGTTGITAGEGDGSKAPAFKGTLNGQLGSIAATIPVTAVDGKVWAKLPIWPNQREITPADYGAPDPAKLFSPEGGISSLFVKTKNPTFGQKMRDGQDVVQVIKGTLSGQDVTSVLVLGVPAQSYDVSYEITDDNRVVNVQLNGVFAGSTKSTYELALSKYGQKVNVTAP